MILVCEDPDMVCREWEEEDIIDAKKYYTIQYYYIIQLVQQWAQKKSLHHINKDSIYTKVMFKVIYCKN